MSATRIRRSVRSRARRCRSTPTTSPTVCVLCSHNCGAARRRPRRRDRRRPRATSEPDHEGLHLQQGVQHPALRRARAARRSIRCAGAPTARFERISLGHGDRRDRRQARRHPRAALAARDRRSSASAARATTWTRRTALGFLRALGSRRWFNAFAQEKTQHNLLDQWMFDASPATFLHADMEHARFLLVLGTNPKISNRGHNATDTLQALRRGPGRARWSSSTRARPRRRAARIATCACGRAPTPTCCSAWPR